ncbi:MAG: TetR/AcrR family transcriptional regulator [Thermocrispum sp.]
MDDAILDAAAELILHLGVPRTQVAEIARRAGVSRPTVYRRWPDVQGIIAALLTREVRVIQDSVTPQGQDRKPMVDGVVEIAVRVRDHPLLGLLLRTDPTVYRKYFIERLGTSQHGLLRALQARISAAQLTGSVRAGDPVQLAAMVLLIAETTVQSYRTVSDLLPDDIWRRELARALNGYLAP